MPPLQWGVENKGISRLPRYMQLGSGKSNDRLTLRESDQIRWLTKNLGRRGDGSND